MSRGLVEFYSEDIDYVLPDQDLVSEWIHQTAERFQKQIEFLSVIFCSDTYLLKLNREHLNHDYFTDIITFPLHDEGANLLSGDLFISVDRVRDNAASLDQVFIDELHRVIIHGVLHMIGFDDQSPDDKSEMRRQEDYSLALRMF